MWSIRNKLHHEGSNTLCLKIVAKTTASSPSLDWVSVDRRNGFLQTAMAFVTQPHRRYLRQPTVPTPAVQVRERLGQISFARPQIISSNPDFRIHETVQDFHVKLLSPVRQTCPRQPHAEPGQLPVGRPNLIGIPAGMPAV
eukprot:364124-Chlamydomonas_euryale.AAC.4